MGSCAINRSPTLLKNRGIQNMHMRHVSPRLIISLCGLCLLIIGLTILPFLKFHTAASGHAATQPVKDTWAILPRPLNPNVSPPPYTTSLYETTTDSTTL